MTKRSNILIVCTETFTMKLLSISCFSIIIFALFSIISCGGEQKKSPRSKKYDYSSVSVKSGPYFKMVICLKAGSQDYYQYDISSKKFFRDSLRRNIPSPYDVGVFAIFSEDIVEQPDVILLSTGSKVGDIVEFLPLGILKYIEGNINKFAVLGVPTEHDKRTMEVKSFLEFITQFDEVKFFIQEWWLSSGNEKKHFSGWGDEKEATRKLDLFMEK